MNYICFKLIQNFMKNAFYLFALLACMFAISCTSEENTIANEQEEEVCFTCEGANGVTICDDNETFRATFNDGVVKIYTYEQIEDIESFQDLEFFLEAEGCDENISILLGIEEGVLIIDEIVEEEGEVTTEEVVEEENIEFTQCLICPAYESLSLGIIVNEQELCEFDGRAWIDGVEQIGVSFMDVLASRRVFTPCQ